MGDTSRRTMRNNLNFFALHFSFFPFPFFSSTITTVEMILSHSIKTFVLLHFIVSEASQRYQMYLCIHIYHGMDIGLYIIFHLNRIESRKSIKVVIVFIPNAMQYLFNAHNIFLILLTIFEPNNEKIFVSSQNSVEINSFKRSHFHNRSVHQYIHSSYFRFYFSIS